MALFESLCCRGICFARNNKQPKWDDQQVFAYTRRRHEGNEAMANWIQKNRLNAVGQISCGLWKKNPRSPLCCRGAVTSCEFQCLPKILPPPIFFLKKTSSRVTVLLDVFQTIISLDCRTYVLFVLFKSLAGKCTSYKTNKHRLTHINRDRQREGGIERRRDGGKSESTPVMCVACEMRWGDALYPK